MHISSEQLNTQQTHFFRTAKHTTNTFASHFPHVAKLKMAVGVETQGDRGGWGSWTEEMDEVAPSWEKGSGTAPSWDNPRYWTKWDLAVGVKRRGMVKRRREMVKRGTRPVISKKQITYPHLISVEDWLTWKKEHDVAERLKSIKAHIAKEDIKGKTRIAGVEEEEMEEAELVAMVSSMDSGAKIVMIKEGGVTQYFVVVHMMGPSNVTTKFTPWVEKEQTKEKTVGGQLRGVEQEVMNLLFQLSSLK